MGARATMRWQTTLYSTLQHSTILSNFGSPCPHCHTGTMKTCSMLFLHTIHSIANVFYILVDYICTHIAMHSDTCTFT
jgi:hypothetical protein